MKMKSSRFILLAWRAFISPFSRLSLAGSVPAHPEEEVEEADLCSSPRWSNERAFRMFSRSLFSAGKNVLAHKNEPYG